MKILVFLQGTIIMHKNAEGKTRQEIIQQVIDQEESVRDFNSYIPIGNAPEKLQKWVSQGTEICYLSALTKNKKARGDEMVGEAGFEAEKGILEKYNFPKGEIHHRESDEDYKDVIERMSPLPDIIIEDDCESIGGKKEMTYPHLSPEIKSKIKSIAIKEFDGIGALPYKISSLIK